MILPFSAPIVGARFHPPAADVLNNLAGETALICVREPDNAYDENAIKVMIDVGLVDVNDFIEPGQEPSDVFAIDEESRYHLGYISRDRAEMLAPYLDEMGGTCPGKLTFNVEGRPAVEMEVESGEA